MCVHFKINTFSCHFPFLMLTKMIEIIKWTDDTDRVWSSYIHVLVKQIKLLCLKSVSFCLYHTPLLLRAHTVYFGNVCSIVWYVQKPAVCQNKAQPFWAAFWNYIFGVVLNRFLVLLNKRIQQTYLTNKVQQQSWTLYNQAGEHQPYVNVTVPGEVPPSGVLICKQFHVLLVLIHFMRMHIFKCSHCGGYDQIMIAVTFWE